MGHQQEDTETGSSSPVFSDTSLAIHRPITFVKTPETIRGSHTQASPKPRKPASRPLEKFMALYTPKTFLLRTAQYTGENAPHLASPWGIKEKSGTYVQPSGFLRVYLKGWLAWIKTFTRMSKGCGLLKTKASTTALSSTRDYRTADIHQGEHMSKNTQTFSSRWVYEQRSKARKGQRGLQNP